MALAQEPGGYLARVAKDSPDELLEALQRAEQLFLEGVLSAEEIEPAAMILHGPEVAIFLRENYAEHSELVDLAARLSALQVIDLRVCETRLDVMDSDRSGLYPFVGTVPFGPRAVNDLLEKKGYVYF